VSETSSGHDLSLIYGPRNPIMNSSSSVKNFIYKKTDLRPKHEYELDLEAEEEEWAALSPDVGLDYTKNVQFRRDPASLPYTDPSVRIEQSSLDSRTVDESCLVYEDFTTNRSDDEPVKNLILFASNHNIMSSLREQKHRLRRDSTVVIIDAGAGFFEDIYRNIFPDINTRPRYVDCFS
jgi:hypothetical protein